MDHEQGLEKGRKKVREEETRWNRKHYKIHCQDIRLGLIKDTAKGPNTETTMEYQTGHRMERKMEDEQDPTKGRKKAREKDIGWNHKPYKIHSQYKRLGYIKDTTKGRKTGTIMERRKGTWMERKT